MRKQIGIAVLLSILCCLPVFGEEKAGQNADTSVVINTLSEIASAVEEWTDKGNRSQELSAELQAMDIGQAYAVVEEEARTQAKEANSQPRKAGNRWGISLSSAEFDLLTRIVMLEAGGESPLGQQAVTEVIFNRMVSPYYGGSLEHVLAAKGQFSTWKSRYSAQAQPTPQVIASAAAVLQGETNILPFETLYFSRKAQNRRVQVRIGGHVFCNQ